jgi:large subunit ribosomal protein L15
MELHSLKPAEGSVQRNVKRVGRGQGSGKGATSGRGHKGDGSRSGSKTKRGFEGGQMPLQRRLPKRGFKNPFRVEYVPVNLIRLQELADEKNITILDFETLCKLGVLSKNAKLKILADGEITAKLTVSAHAFSAAAKEAIEKAGGTATQI